MPLVCIDCRYIRERPSGISPLQQALVDHLPRLAPDLEFHFLKHPKGPARLSSTSGTRESFLRAEANGPGTLFAMPALVDLRGVDLFHATFNILPHGLRMPTLVTLCDVMWVKYPAWARGPGAWGHVETAFYQHGIRHAMRAATRLAAISQATKDEIASLDPAAAARTRVTLLGTSDEFRPPPGGADPAALGAVRAKWLPGARRHVLTVGQFAPYKNHPNVVRAFAHAFRDRPDVHLGLVQRLGDGERVLRPIARELGVAERVHFLAGVPFGELVQLFQGAVALCHPSLYEGFGNPPAEALMAGCPVVTSNRSSMPEVSQDAALLVDPEDPRAIGDALRRVADEPGLAERMRARGLARARELSWEAFARANLDVYREILADRR